jgi:hypothetical protein
LLAVTSTSLPYFMTGLTYVLYVVFIVSYVFPHVAPASRFMSRSLWLTLFVVCCTWFLQDSLLSMYTPRYFVLFACKVSADILNAFQVLCSAEFKSGIKAWSSNSCVTKILSSWPHLRCEIFP